VVELRFIFIPNFSASQMAFSIIVGFQEGFFPSGGLKDDCMKKLSRS